MRVAFTSCMDARTISQQIIWTSISRHKPDVLLLVGDIVYMDYGFGLFFNKVRNWSETKFADVLYERYLLQSNVEEFRLLLSEVEHFESTWDDHDFAWNNSYVNGGGKNAVPLKQRLISKALRSQFTTWAKNGAKESYPNQPTMEQMLSETDSGIEKVLDIEGVKIILLDARYYRSNSKRSGSESMLGSKQREWLLEQTTSAPGPCLVCTGTTLAGSKESWDKYMDYDWMVENIPANVTFLSGDIHDNEINQYAAASGNIFDVTASGAARKNGQYRLFNRHVVGNYGVLDSDGNKVHARCFNLDEMEHEQLIS